ncbi:MAG: hypothetical protein R3F59_24860 [Myxococcota bacterium]
MRRTLAPLLLSAGLAGCTDTCPPPTSIADEVWTVFVNPVSWEGDNEAAFPADTSPANGVHTLSVVWPSDAPDGNVTVTIDDQAFQGRGRWDETECGTFALGFNGRYEAGGDVHAFSCAATLVTWQGNVDGYLDWEETWQSAEGEIGSFSSQAQLRSIQP